MVELSVCLDFKCAKKLLNNYFQRMGLSFECCSNRELDNEIILIER